MNSNNSLRVILSFRYSALILAPNIPSLWDVLFISQAYTARRGHLDIARSPPLREPPEERNISQLINNTNISRKNQVAVVGMVGAGLVPARWAHRAGTSPAPTIPTTATWFFLEILVLFINCEIFLSSGGSL